MTSWRPHWCSKQWNSSHVSVPNQSCEKTNTSLFVQKLVTAFFVITTWDCKEYWDTLLWRFSQKSVTSFLHWEISITTTRNISKCRMTYGIQNVNVHQRILKAWFSLAHKHKHKHKHMYKQVKTAATYALARKTDMFVLLALMLMLMS